MNANEGVSFSCESLGLRDAASIPPLIAGWQHASFKRILAREADSVPWS